MKYMRIVSMGCGVNIQESEDRNEWRQRHMTDREFGAYMQKNFRREYSDFLVSEAESPVRFFYHYGETPEMVRLGEAHVFEKE